MAEAQWYYCLLHHAVEPYEGCRAEDRLGPYSSREEAAHALDLAQERNEAWEHDPRFKDDEDDESEDDDTEGWGPFKH